MTLSILGPAVALVVVQALAVPVQDEVFDPPAAAVPFGVGEKLEFQVKLGPVKVGGGSFEVSELESIHGNPTYRLEMRLKGGVPLYKVDDHFQSWMDVRSLVSRRFKQNQREGGYRRNRTFDFFPEEQRWARLDNDEKGELATREPLDDISFLYYARTLPLEVGQTYTLARYFKDDGNPVVIKVLRRDTVEVPAGRFATIVVQPVIQTKGLFGKGGKAEVHFSDDIRRLIVQVKSSVPIVGSLNMYLEKFTLGDPVAVRGRRADAGG